MPVLSCHKTRLRIEKVDILIWNLHIGIRKTNHRFKNIKGYGVCLPCVFYHLTTTQNRLSINQIYHHIHDGNISVCADRIDIHLYGHKIVIPIDKKGSNLLICFDSAVNSDQKKEFGLHYISGMA